MKLPSPEHPITIEPHAGRVVVRFEGRVVADTRGAVILREGRYPAVFYVPREDADMGALERSEHTTYCPYKGEAAYYTLVAGTVTGLNAVWTYEAPYPAMADIAGRLAFYADQVEIVVA